MQAEVSKIPIRSSEAVDYLSIRDIAGQFLIVSLSPLVPHSYFTASGASSLSANV